MARRPSYDEIEHTADVGIEFRTADLKSAFERAAAAMFDLIVDLDQIEDRTRRTVTVEGRDSDPENLLVRWLSQLLFMFETESLLLASFSVKLEGPSLVAHCSGEHLDTSRHFVKNELKAATYHGIALEDLGDEWLVRIIFDA